MSAQPTAVLGTFISRQARAAVVRLRDPHLDDHQVFTGFFVSSDGHLLTVFHALRHELWDTGSRAEFELELEFDSSDPGDEHIVRTNAICEPGWRAFPADWALLRVDYAPSAYLPLQERQANRPTATRLLSELCSYGFTDSQREVCRLGAFAGQYARALPERSQFRLTYVNRGLGQSGSPVIDMHQLSAIGVLANIYDSSGELLAGDSQFGARTAEALTCDAAVIDQTVLGSLTADFDLATLATRWRQDAVQYLCDNTAEFGMLSSRDYRPNLPERYIRGRRVAREVAAGLQSGDLTHVLLHGTRGSGKTTLALEIAEELQARGAVEAVFWYNFEPEANHTVSALIRKLALHFALHEGVYGPLELYSFQSGSDATATMTALVDAIAAARHLLVFENVHVPQRDGDMAVLSLLEDILEVSTPAKSKVVLSSWDEARAPLRPRAFQVEGLTGEEVEKFFRLHDIELSERTRGYIAEYASDVTCLEQFARSPEWRQSVEAGNAAASEPDLLLRYWVGQFLDHVPDEAHHILVALAVLNMPSDRKAIEFVSGARNFARTLSLVQTSPPLVYVSNNQYDIHTNVRRAVLATTDSDDLRIAHQRSAEYLAKSREFVLAAEHHVAAGEAERAADLLYANRDEIIASGRVLELEESLRELRESVEGAEASLYHIGIVLASCSTMKGEYTAAVQHLEYALEETIDDLDQAMLHNRRGDNFRLASDYRSAKDAYSTAERIAAGGRGPRFLKERARADLGLAKLARLRCDYTAAKTSYEAAHQIFVNAYDRNGLIETDFGLGEIGRLVRDWQESEDHYRKSLQRARMIGSLEREAYALYGLAEVNRLTGVLEEAERLHRDGLELCTKVGDTRSEGWALLCLAETYRAGGQTNKALAAYEQAESKFLQTHSHTELAHVSLGAAEAHRLVGTPRFDLYEKAEAIYRERDVHHCLVLCCLTRASAALSGSTPSGERSPVEYLAEGLELAERYSLAYERTLAEAMIADPARVVTVPLNFP